ncbi:MAG: flagellar M-ring protein FliF [Opitutales bacterium TMED158]|nr:MAG: flagellar M-ring protein FliF [Opitutales bacterium TMED158]
MGLLNQFKELWHPLGANQKISLGLAAGLVVLAMVALMIWAGQPNMQLLYGNLDAEEAGEIAEKLEQKNVGYETGKNGQSIYVESGKVHRLRWELAAEGLVPSGTGPGFELFDEGSFGISDFVQRTNYLRAIKGELERTITQFSGVRTARVMVVMPENRIIVTSEGRDRATASVMVDTNGSMTLSAVNSIRHLVANSVQGLNLNDVVVVDSQGVVLSEELQSTGLNGGLSNEVIRYRKGLEVYFTTKVQSMLDRVLGPNQSEVRVAVDVDTASVQTTEESFDPEGVLRSETIDEKSMSEKETGSVAGGVAGTDANLTNGEGAGGTITDREDSTEQTSKQYEIGKVTSNRIQSPGTIRRLTASLFVAKRMDEAGVPVDRTVEDLQRLRQIVINALGIQLENGQAAEDLVTVTEMEFAADPYAMQTQDIKGQVDYQQWIDLGKNAAGIALGVGIIFFFLQMLKKNAPEQISIEVLQPEQVLQSRKLEDTGTVTPEMLNELIRQKPANIGVSLRDWIGEPEKR